MKAPIFKVNPLHPEEDKIRTISKILINGGLLIIPTETVYGVAADQRSQKAVSRLYKIKQRPKDRPFSILIDNKEKLMQLRESSKKWVNNFSWDKTANQFKEFISSIK